MSTTTISVEEIVDSVIAEGRKTKEQNSWYSSGLGSCLTSRYLERSGARPDKEFEPRTLRVFEMGNRIETFVVDAIRTRFPAVETQVPFRFRGLTGKADVVVGENVKEIKSVRSDDFWMMARGKRPPKIQHKMQLWSQLEGLGREQGQIVYVSKDDLAIVEFTVFRNSDGLREAVTAEVDYLDRCWEAKLPPEPVKWDFDDRRFVPLSKDDWQLKYSRWAKQVFIQPEYLKP